MILSTLRVALGALLAAGSLAAQEQPYGGQEARDIASLSQADVADILAGEGWGLAKPAELNGYPGPAHILELAEALDLTEAQRAQVQALFDGMKARAQAAGADYVAAETHLSQMFRAGHATPQMLDTVLAQSSAALAELRAVHLEAHLAASPILTETQRARYAELRGYGLAGGASGHDGHGQH